MRRKRRRIKSFDILKALESSKNDRPGLSSRMIWERCISEIDLNSFTERSSKLCDLQLEITNLISVPPVKKRKKVEDSSSITTVVSKGSTRSSIGKGKNLAAMVVRRQLDELSKKGSSPCSSERSSNVKNDFSRPPLTIALDAEAASKRMSSLPGKSSSRPPSALGDPLDISRPSTSGSTTCIENSNNLGKSVDSNRPLAGGSHSNSSASPGATHLNPKDSHPIILSRK